MKSKFKKLMAAALVLCLMLALLPAGVLAEGPDPNGGEDGGTPPDPNTKYTITYKNAQGTEKPDGNFDFGSVYATAEGEAYAKTSFDSGTKVTITAEPKDNCGLVSLKVGNEDVKIADPKGKTTYVIDGISSNVDVVVAFRPYYTISADNANCTVNVVTEEMRGIDVSFTVNPNRGYEVSAVKLNGSELQPVNGTYTFTMPDENVTIGVELATLQGYTITIPNTENGIVEVVTPSDLYYPGENIHLYVKPDSSYELDSLTVTKSNDESVSVTDNAFTMPASNVTVSATFKKVETPPPVVPDTYKVNVSSTTGGSAWADKSDLEAGEWVTITVDPYDGYWLESLTVNGADVTDKIDWDWYWNWYYDGVGTYSFRIYEDTNVYATFATRYDDDIACIYDGRYGNVTVKVWDEVRDKFVTTTSADKGDLVAVIVEPFSGYAMSDLTIRERNDWDYVSYDSSWKYDNVYYFYMPGDDVNIYVDFTEAASEHIVYVDTAKNGTLKADTTWAAYGQKVYVTATPDKGYELSSLFVKTARGEQLKVYEAKKADTYYFYMPDEYVTVSAWFAPEASALPFADVSYTNWYYDAVKFVYDKGIMDGVSYYRFAPDATITRGMVVTMLWRMAGEPYESSAGFTDVASGRYYSTAVAWAAKNGIVEGMTSSTFAPDQAITREQLASILYRYARWLGFSGTGTDISGYTDAGKVSDYAYDAMCWAVKTGVVTGTSAKVLDPQGTATRAAAAQMFMNFYNYIY